MKKLYCLIILTVILGLVLTGCTLLSNISQVPTTGQSGITYLTKHSILDPVLVGLWHFDGDALDSSANSNHGTLMGNTSWTSSGRFDYALSFDGDGDYVDFGSGVTAPITGDYTVEAWIKPASLDSGRHVVMSFSYMELGHDAGKVYFRQCYDSSWSKGYIYKSTEVLLDVTEFSHIVGVFRKDVGVDLYVDGNYIGSDTEKTGTTLNIFGKTYAGVWYTAGGGWFDGIIDEVRIWDGALTAEQIKDSADHGIVIQKEMSQDEAVLGDHVTITLEVVTAPAPVTITDILPNELSYIPGTFEVDGVLVDPTVDGQTISYDIAQPCAYTIIFDAQVTSAEAVATLVTNEATAGDVSASAELTIHPYEGFEKEVEIKFEDTVDGVVEVNELVQWDMTITVPNNFAWPISDATLSDRLGAELGMAGDEVDNNLSGGIDEGVPGDLDSMYNTIPSGTLDIKVRGKANKVQFKITGISISSFGSAEFVLGIFTDKNPAGKQCYTSDGTYELNSGAVLKFIDPGTGFQLSAHTPPIDVEVTEPE